MKQLIAIVLSLLLFGYLGAQDETQTIRKNYSFEHQTDDNLLIIRNINGNIDVEPATGNQIELELEIVIKGNSQADRRKGLSEVKFGVIEKSRTLLFYMDAPCSNIDPATVTEEQLRKGEQYSWSNNCRWHPKYDYRFNYRVKVPKNINLQVSTVNHGDIAIVDQKGDIEVNNVNGSIDLKKVAGRVDAHTVNGDLNVTHAANPDRESTYYTLNGTLNAYYQKGLSADVFFKSFNGDFYTDIDAVEVLPTMVEREMKGNEKGVRFKIGQSKGIRVREGGVKLQFETFNGNVYLREL